VSGILYACGEPQQTYAPVVAPVVVETRTFESLKLELDRGPAFLPDPPLFGAAPDSGWLDESNAFDELNAAENTLLPALFDGKEQGKLVDIKGRVLIDESTNDISDLLDGAEMSIEIKTDWTFRSFTRRIVAGRPIFSPHFLAAPVCSAGIPADVPVSRCW